MMMVGEHRSYPSDLAHGLVMWGPELAEFDCAKARYFMASLLS